MALSDPGVIQIAWWIDRGIQPCRTPKHSLLSRPMRGRYEAEWETMFTAVRESSHQDGWRL